MYHYQLLPHIYTLPNQHLVKPQIWKRYSLSKPTTGKYKKKKYNFSLPIIYKLINHSSLSDFSNKKYYPVIFMFSFDLFPAFFRQTACYPPLKNKKYPQKSFQAWPKQNPYKSKTSAKIEKSIDWGSTITDFLWFIIDLLNYYYDGMREN